MKTRLLFFLSLFFYNLVCSQITTPIIRANFGVDADLRANYFNGFLQAGNDDWFNNGTGGTGRFVIDTNGAASMVQRFSVDPAFRRQPFFRTMAAPQYSIINNRLWIDAIYIRDYNGQSGGDETAFVSSNKNGDSPGNWQGGTTSVLDKNDISDMMVHVRRDGPTKDDALWFFGGLSLQGTTGNRYFDFELYQTDIFYTRSTGEFSNYGPDAGHTSWQFDANGDITKPGDVIFSAEYSSSSLTFVEARVWVHRSALSITPRAFDWSGSFDGASTGAEYGYASIKPKIAGTYYSGLQSTNGTWAGPFGFIDGGNTFRTTYTARQFMEFSVNLTFLGLDPITLLGGGACGLPFRRILVKTRTSTSFSSELKDFIGPFDFFTAPRVDAQATVPYLCDTQSVSAINVLNPLPASVYNWSTPDGRILGSTTGSTITVDTAGTYIVSQQLLDGCGSYARDTVIVGYFPDGCTTLDQNSYELKGEIRKRNAHLNWQGSSTQTASSVLLQRSTDGKNFQTISAVSMNASQDFTAIDDITSVKTPYVFYRLQIKESSGRVQYSNTVRLLNDWKAEGIHVFPNPASNKVQVLLPAARGKDAIIKVFDLSGALISMEKIKLNAAPLVHHFKNVENWRKGLLLISVQIDETVYTQKLMLTGKEQETLR